MDLLHYEKGKEGKAQGAQVSNRMLQWVGMVVLHQGWARISQEPIALVVLVVHPIQWHQVLPLPILAKAVLVRALQLIVMLQV